MSTLPPLTDFVRFVWARFQDSESRDRATMTKVREFAAENRKLADHELRAHTVALMEEVQQGAECGSEHIVTRAFALVNEAARRTIGIEYYDVQLLAGMVLARRAIAEMHTGEGKTFVAALPAFVFALTGRGVHVMTSNAYLAERDYEQLTPVFQLLGLSVGVLKPHATPAAKKAAYQCDVTYGPGYEFGFDYLRDQAALLARPKPELGERHRRLMRGEVVSEAETIQRGHAFAIVDEIDSVMLDEATSPLILSAGANAPAAFPEIYEEALAAADQLESNLDYVVDETSRVVRLSAQGDQKVKALLKKQAVNGQQRPWATYVEHALRTKLLLKRDVDYVVSDDKILLVDESTGRIFDDRSLREGLHQAIEAKENVTITAEREPLARITRQRFFRLYEAICGMTGTASDNDKEFRHFYRLPVVPIPLHRPSGRSSAPTCFFADEDSKRTAIVEEVERIHRTSQPVLVGTRTIANSIKLAERLDAEGIPYQLLNGRQDADEAAIVARAGQAGTITIATNMAGRGTDIKLGPGVPELGGLHVIVSEPHGSARIDRQLMGRCARQGDPGSCRLFVSANDELIVRYAPDLKQRLKRQADQTVETFADYSDEIVRVQRRAEQADYARRHQLFAQDDWMDEVLSKLAKDG